MPLRHFCGHSIHNLCLHTFPRVLPPSRSHLNAKTGHTYSSRGSWKTFYLIREGPHNTAALLLLHWKEILGQTVFEVPYPWGGLEPSVAQPPLPLQEFLPLQPLSLALHPPLPLQEFCPLQACFSFTWSWDWSC